MRIFTKDALLILTLGISAVASASVTKTIGGIEYRLESDGVAAVTGSVSSIEAAVIPYPLLDEGKEYSVTSIERSAFANRHALKSVVIPSSVTSIGEYAFYASDAIPSITIPSSVSEIGKCAFWNCTNLVAIDLPEALKIIPESIFYGCKSLASIDVPQSVDSIAAGAFEKCTAMTSAVLPSGLKSISQKMFYDCYALADVNIPSSVKFIDKSAFSECRSLTRIDIPSSVERINSFAFYACEALKSVTIPSSVMEIGESAFWNCRSLEYVSIPASVAEIKNGTFYGCSSLKTAILPESVSSIGDRGFERCFELNTVILPASMTAIGENAFWNCEKLATVVSYALVPPAIQRYAFLYNAPDAVVYVPAEALESYPSATGWTVFNDFRPLGSVDMTISRSQLDLQVNDRFTLTVEVEKAFDVEIDSESWTSTNTEVATVDGGVVSAVGEGWATVRYTLVDGNGCPHIVSCDVYVEGVAGVGEVASEDVAPEYYNLNGIRVDAASLSPGLYIRRQGNRSVRILIK